MMMVVSSYQDVFTPHPHKCHQSIYSDIVTTSGRFASIFRDWFEIFCCYDLLFALDSFFYWN